MNKREKSEAKLLYEWVKNEVLFRTGTLREIQHVLRIIKKVIKRHHQNRIDGGKI